MKPEHFQRDDFEGIGMRRRKYNGGSGTVLVGSQPVSSGDAPAIARDEAREAVLGHWCLKVVPDAGLVVEEFTGHDRADGVAAVVAIVGVARSVAKEARERIISADSEFGTENV